MIGCRNTSPNRQVGEAAYGNADARRVYAAATRLDAFEGEWPPQDTGSSGLAACKAAMTLGLISSYQWCFGLDHLVGVLVKRPVTVGTPWYAAMFNPAPNGLVTIGGEAAGGHEWLVVGYDLIEQVIFAVNSWGREWGVNGTFVVGFDDMRRLLAEDGDIKVPIR